nr:hypothetical protein [Tanacetum cinerariifolium]
HLPLQLELSDPFPDLPDLVLYFKISDSLTKSFNLDIARITPVMPVASGGESTALAMMIFVPRHLEIT